MTENTKKIRLTFLGTGTSTGIPQIGCNCVVCRSEDSRDKRLRASVLVETEGNSILIDAGPDLRAQLLSTKVRHLSGILITHEHYDHLGGLDDIRPLGETTIYAEARVLKHIRQVLPYCFSEKLYPGVPRIQLFAVEKEDFYIDRVGVKPIRFYHANLPILGYRIGKMAYLTDLKTISEESIEQLKGLDVLILNALRMHAHISHITLAEAIELAQRIGAARTYFTHFSHDLGKHAAVENTLPENMYLSYDGLVVDC